MIDHIKNETFGERLRRLRISRGYHNQGMFAKALGIKQPSLSELENKTTGEPAASTLLRAAKVLSVEPDFLLTGKGPEERYLFSDLTEEEKQTVLFMRAIGAEGRADIVNYANRLYIEQHPLRSAANPYGQSPVATARHRSPRS